ncbi:MAG: NAD(P)-dependent oxidoreductase [Lysobacteraceae bacterium]
MTNLRCGFIGLGGMGAPMSRHLAARGLLAVVGNRTFSKAQALAAELGVAASETAYGFADCDVVMLCVGVDADVLQNVAELAQVLKPGAVVVDHSTVAPATARQAAAMLADKNIGFVDAPVSGGVEGARNGKLSVMAGGDHTHLEKARPALECYAMRLSHLGGVGQGQATKAVNQVMVAGINEAVCEALALGKALGLDAETLIPTLASGAAANWFLDKRGTTMLAGQFTPGFKCGFMLKDLRIVEATAREAGVAHPATRQALADYERIVAEGGFDDDTSALIRLKLPQ